MREFMVFCLEVLQELVSMMFDVDIGGYSYGDFLVACLLVSALLGALVIRFTPSRSDFTVSRPPRVHDGGSSGSSAAD